MPPQDYSPSRKRNYGPRTECQSRVTAARAACRFEKSPDSGRALVKAPLIEINQTQVCLVGRVGETVSFKVKVQTLENRPVFAHAWSDQAWLTAQPPKILGSKVTLPFTVGPIPNLPGQTLRAKITVRANGNQKFAVAVDLHVHPQVVTLGKTTRHEPVAASLNGGVLSPVPVVNGRASSSGPMMASPAHSLPPPHFTAQGQASPSPRQTGGSGNSRKVILFGLLGALGCLIGCVFGEGFLWACFPVSKDAVGSLASRPELPPISAISPPAPPVEFAQRLDMAGAKSGDVQISLIWFNRNDLDLHCIDPSGEHIFFGRRISFSGGELDVDMNVRGETDQPVENIYWPIGKAPLGRYKVLLHHFSRNQAASDPTPYKINVLVAGRRQDYVGTISVTDPIRFICEFEVKKPGSELRLAVSPEIVVNQRGKSKLMARIASDGMRGPVRLWLEGDIAGISTSTMSIPENETELTAEISADDVARLGTRSLTLVASSGSMLTDSRFLLTVKESVSSPKWSWWLIVVIGLWTALLAIGLSLALVMGQNWYLARPLLSPRELGLLLGGGLAAGLTAGGVGQTLYGVMNLIKLIPEIGFLAGWMLLGGLLGRGLVFFIPNLSPWRASAAGICGGFLGAAGFIIISTIGDTAGRLTGAAILGFAIGLMVAIVELVYRKLWLEVVYSPTEICTVNLGATPVSFGGDARKCTVLVPGAPGMALRFWEKDGLVYCLDVLKEKTHQVAIGYRHPLKQVEVVVCSNK